MIPVTGLDPGTYLFTSARCAECAVARSQLESFTEISWEGQPDVFNRLGVTAVPSTLVVDSAGVVRTRHVGLGTSPERLLADWRAVRRVPPGVPD